MYDLFLNSVMTYFLQFQGVELVTWLLTVTLTGQASKRLILWSSFFLCVRMWNSLSHSNKRSAFTKNEVPYCQRTRFSPVTLMSSGAVGWDTALQTGRSRVRSPIMSLEFFHLHNPSVRNMVLGLTQALTEMSTRNISWGVKAAGA